MTTDQIQDNDIAPYQVPVVVSVAEIPLSDKAKVLKSINSQTPTNEYGFPAVIYRADLVPSDMDILATAERSDMLQAASMEMDYSQGYPMLPNGEPFWAQMPCEPSEAYRAFLAYLDMPRVKTNGQEQPVRQIHLLKVSQGKSVGELLSMCHLYYWPSRVRAYDLFVIASTNKQKEYRLQDADAEHYRIASKFIKEAEDFLTEVFAAPPEDSGLKPKEAMDLLLKMIQVQRLSLGTTPFGSSNVRDSASLPAGSSLEVILRTIAQQTNAHNTGTENNNSNTIKNLFADKGALQQAQELVIKMNTATNPRKSNNAALAEGSGFLDHNT